MNRSDTGAEFASLSREQLRDGAVRVLKQAENTRADVLLLEHGGRRAVLKDYTESNPGFSLFIAPLLVWREARTLKKLGSLDGIPALVTRVSARAFVMEYCESTGLREINAGFDWEAYIGRAGSLVDAMHRQGVVHGDLRNYTNFMVTVDGAPVLVDFVSAVHRGAWWNPVGAILFNLFRQLDDGGLYKLKKRYAPQLITVGELDRFENPGLVERLARSISGMVRALVRSIFRI